MTDGLYVPLCTPGFRRSADRSSRGDSQSFRDCRVDRVSPRAVESNRAGSFALCISSPAAASSLSFSFSCLLPRSIRPLAFSFVNPPHRYPATRTMASTVIPTAILLLAATRKLNSTQFQSQRNLEYRSRDGCRDCNKWNNISLLFASRSKIKCLCRTNHGASNERVSMKRVWFFRN